jgi:PAS domain S-box-containing protein
MKDEAKTKTQLMAELITLRRRVAELEIVEARCQQVEAESQQRMAQLEALRQVELELTAEHDLDTMLNSIVLRAIELLGATGGSIDLYRPELNALELIMVVGEPAKPIGALLRQGEGLSGKVWQTRQPLVVDNYQTWPGRAAIYENDPFTTVMGVPIQLGQEFLGVLIVVNRPTPFSSADVELLSLFATQAAIAIRNANLIDSLRDNERSYKTLFAIERRQAQERFLLERVGTALARELDLSTTLRTIVEAIAETFGYTQVSIYLRQGDVLKLQHQVGYDRVIAEIPVTQGVSGRVVRTGQPILIKDVSTDPDFLGAIEGLVSEICVPLFDQDKVVGFFNIEGTHEVTLDEADLRLMIALSEHISLAINRARLYTEAKENEERFRQLAENIEDVFWMTNLDGAETIYVSPAFEELWGFSRQRMFEQPTAWMENLHPKDLERVIASFKERDLTQPDLKEYRLVRPDGSIRWVRDRAFPVRNESGQIYRRAGIIEDITARKQAEQQLAES